MKKTVNDQLLTDEIEERVRLIYGKLEALDGEIKKQAEVIDRLSDILLTLMNEKIKAEADADDIYEYRLLISKVSISTDCLCSAVAETRKLNRKLMTMLDNGFLSSDKERSRLKKVALNILRSCDAAEKAAEQNMKNVKMGRDLLRSVSSDKIVE